MTPFAMFGAVYGIGVMVSIIGAIKLPLAASLAIEDGKVGGLITSMTGSSLVTGFIAGPLLDIAGFRFVAVTGFLTGAVAVALLTSARSYFAAVLSSALMGVGAMSLNIFVNILLPKVLFGGTNVPAALSLGHAVFGLGAFLTPFIIGLLVHRIGLGKTGSLFSLSFVVLGFTAVFAAFPSAAKGFSVLGALSVLNDPVVLLVTFALVLYIGLESTMGGWITTYAVAAGMSLRRAETLLALFWLIFSVARLLNTFVVTPDTGRFIMPVLAMVTVFSLGVMIRARRSLIAGLAIICTGFAFGPVFPTVVSVALVRFPPGLAGSGFGIINSIGLLGPVILPAMVGLRSQRSSIRQALVIPLAVAVVLFLTTVSLAFV